MNCPSCQAPSGPEARFCGVCGAPLGEDPLGVLRAAGAPRALCDRIHALLRGAPHGEVVVVGGPRRGRTRLAEALAGAGFAARETAALGEDEGRLLEDCAGASAVVLVLASHQLLGREERAFVRDLAAWAPVRLALAVGFMDWIEDEEDREAVERRATSFARTLAVPPEVVFLDEPLPAALAAWLREAPLPASARSVARRQALRALADELEAALPVEEEPEPLAADRMAREVEAEHGRALRAARIELDRCFLELSQDVEGWFLQLDAEERAHEGVDRLVRASEDAMGGAVRTYLQALESGLLADTHGVLQAAAEGLGERERVGDTRTSGLHLRTRHRSRSALLIASALGATVGVLLLPSAPLWIGAGLASASLMGGWSVRRQRQQALETVHLDEVRSWLEATRERASEQLGVEAERVKQALLARLEEVVERAESSLGSAETTRAAAALAALRERIEVTDGT